MALKLLKVNVGVNLKADPSDQDDLRERLYETLQILIESDELEFELSDEEEDLEMEE